MKANYNITGNGRAEAVDRKQRRVMIRRLQPKIKRIVELEMQIKNGVDKESAETEMTQIIESCTMVEMFAMEDYIYNKHLLDNK